jgi:hypothetical protein
MNNILNSGFSKLSPEALAAKTSAIMAACTNNPNFLQTDPTMAEVQAKLDALNKALSMPKGQARDEAVEATRTGVEQILADLADDLENEAKGDLVKLATTGFDLRKAPVHSGDSPTIPLNLHVRLTGVTGEVQALFSASDRATGYQLQTSYDPVNGPWIDSPPFSSSRRVILKGLIHGKDVWVRVRAVGPNNTMSGWSDPATILVS